MGAFKVLEKPRILQLTDEKVYGEVLALRKPNFILPILGGHKLLWLYEEDPLVDNVGVCFENV